MCYCAHVQGGHTEWPCKEGPDWAKDFTDEGEVGDVGNGRGEVSDFRDWDSSESRQWLDGSGQVPLGTRFGANSQVSSSSL